MNNHVTTFEQSKKLKDIGLEQKCDGLASYYKFKATDGTFGGKLWYIIKLNRHVITGFPVKEMPDENLGKEFRAFTLAELIEVLGDKFEAFERRSENLFVAHGGKKKDVDGYGYSLTGNSIIEAVYNLIITLHKEGLLFNEKKDE